MSTNNGLKGRSSNSQISDHLMELDKKRVNELQGTVKQKRRLLDLIGSLRKHIALMEKAAEVRKVESDDLFRRLIESIDNDLSATAYGFAERFWKNSVAPSIRPTLPEARTLPLKSVERAPTAGE